MPQLSTHQPLRAISCAPECGFLIRSHNDKEVMAAAVAHARTAHGRTFSEADARKMMVHVNP
ncbi:MAG: DUF1059 domain-containing protein [bacterium]